MSFDWREYLDLAEALMGRDSKPITIEAAFRCSMSRIYYAAFCHARNYAQKKQSFAAKCMLRTMHGLESIFDPVE